jgi:hypothetical protein
MRSRRPPEILRKSHAHGAGKGRAKGKAALKREIEIETDVAERDAPPDDDAHAPPSGHDKRGRHD